MSSPLPTRVLAGITVPDTSLISAAIAFAKAHLSPMTFNHIMRSFLFGACIASKDPASSTLDREAHALSAILHDMGWDETGRLVSKDKRFEVDGADAARSFLAREAPSWESRRVQLVWDAIALHTTRSISLYKEAEVALCSQGILLDFSGPDGSEGKMTWEEYDAVVKEFPRLEFAEGVKEILCRFCRDKPQTTWDNFVGDVGEEFVPGYTRKGNKTTDRLRYTRAVLDAREA